MKQKDGSRACRLVAFKQYLAFILFDYEKELFCIFITHGDKFFILEAEIFGYKIKTQTIRFNGQIDTFELS